MRKPLILLAAFLAAYGLLAWLLAPKAAPASFGVTFSPLYAQEIGLDWKETFTALLDDLQVRRFRIPLYWNRIERERGTFDWSETDWIVEEASKRGAKLTLAIGRKTPRWPECHEPEWVKDLDPKNQRLMTLELLRQEIGRYRTSPAVVRWQVENESLFRFGKCPPPDFDFLKQEVMLTRQLDTRPIVLTDSGELSGWLRTSGQADVLGLSLYRLVWNDIIGYTVWPVTPRFYSDRIALIRAVSPVKEIFVSELQAEPWFHRPVPDTPLDEQFASMDLPRFKDSIAFARKTGATEIDLWGAEWWYWLKTKQNVPEFWETAREIWSSTNTH